MCTESEVKRDFIYLFWEVVYSAFFVNVLYRCGVPLEFLHFLCFFMGELQGMVHLFYGRRLCLLYIWEVLC